MNRRTLLTMFSSSLVVSVGGCINREPQETDDEHACTRETWAVIVYNESASEKSMTVTFTDAEDQVVFSDTIELEPNIGQFSGIELDAEVFYDRSYIFEANIPGGDGASTETVVNCGNVYIGVTESGDVKIRDDSHEGD